MIISESANANTPSKVDEKTKDEMHMNDVVSEFKKLEIAGELKPEPMLLENPGRFVLFPIKHSDIWKMYKQAESSFWTAEELDLAQDATDWEKLTENDKKFIKNVQWAIHVMPDVPWIATQDPQGELQGEAWRVNRRCWHSFGKSAGWRGPHQCE